MNAKERIERYPGLYLEARRLIGVSENLEKNPDDSKLQSRMVEKRLAEIIDEMEKITDAVMRLSDPLERLVLQMRYFDGKQGKGVRWKDVAKGIRGRGDAKDEKFVYRLHNSALLHLDEILGNS